MADGIKQPKKKAEQPELERFFTEDAAEGAKSRVRGLLENMAGRKSASFEILSEAIVIGKDLYNNIDELTNPHTKAEIAKLKEEQERLVDRLSALADLIFEREKPKKKKAAPPAEIPKPAAEVPKPAPKIVDEILKPAEEWVKPHKPVEAPKPAPKIAKQPEERVKPKPAPEPAKSAAAPKAAELQEELKWKDGAITFATRDFKSIRVTNSIEKWSVLVSEDGSWAVRLQRPGGTVVTGTLQGDKFEGTLEEGSARAIHAYAASLVAGASAKLREKLKEKAKEEEEGAKAWKSQDEWR